MSNVVFHKLPRQRLSFKAKTKEWRKKHLDWADQRVFLFDNSIRQSLIRKRINYNLVNGYASVKDMELVLNPYNIVASYIPSEIRHYPIINSKLNVLRGEEARRRFDYKVIVTNSNAISEIEETKKELLLNELNLIFQESSQNEEEFNKKIEKLSYYYTYEWQDMREQRGSYLLNHYMKEYNIPIKFNQGFMDAMIVGEEIYQCDIVGGEPIIERINPMHIFIFRNSYSYKIEDADVIVLIEYWSPAKIIDSYYDVLSSKDIAKLDELPKNLSGDTLDNFDERDSFIYSYEGLPTETAQSVIFDGFAPFLPTNNNVNIIDNNGNIRVVRVYWKSQRKIKKVKSYDPETGEEVYNFYPEDYIIDKSKGEEEEIFWINEAWEGTKIAKDIYVNMRPRVVQYNRLSNPSRCHFGIVGSLYSLNQKVPFSLVDMMKPYSYMYDIIHDRLNKAIAANWGKILKLDLALVPKGWDVDKWMYFAKVNHIAVTDSFKEGNVGLSTGKLAGMMNNQSSGVIDAETGNYIQNHINLLEWIKQEMSEAGGISKQREGQIANRETVGGVERATLQSSHITEWLFTMHDDVKRRALECFLETAKIAMRGKTTKFQYILDDGSSQIVNIEGDEFAEADYGILVDNSQETQRLTEKLETLAQAALQNQTLSFSSIIKIISSPSLAEIRRTIVKDERDRQEATERAQQQQLEAQQQIAQMNQQTELMKLEQADILNRRDNETKILLEQLKASNNNNETISKLDQLELDEKTRQFNEQMRLERDRLAFEKSKSDKELAARKVQMNRK